MSTCFLRFEWLDWLLLKEVEKDDEGQDDEVIEADDVENEAEAGNFGVLLFEVAEESMSLGDSSRLPFGGLLVVGVSWDLLPEWVETLELFDCLLKFASA